jgi:hypothetical protein
MACFQDVEEMQFHKNLCLEQLIAFSLLPSIFLGGRTFSPDLLSRRLTAGLGRGVIGRSVVLQELIHGLQGLIVLVEDLQILNRGGGLRG